MYVMISLFSVLQSEFGSCDANKNEIVVEPSHLP